MTSILADHFTSYWYIYAVNMCFTTTLFLREDFNDVVWTKTTATLMLLACVATGYLGYTYVMSVDSDDENIAPAVLVIIIAAPCALAWLSAQMIKYSINLWRWRHW